MNGVRKWPKVSRIVYSLKSLLFSFIVNSLTHHQDSFLFTFLVFSLLIFKPNCSEAASREKCTPSRECMFLGTMARWSAWDTLNHEFEIFLAQSFFVFFGKRFYLLRITHMRSGICRARLLFAPYRRVKSWDGLLTVSWPLERLQREVFTKAGPDITRHTNNVRASRPYHITAAAQLYRLSHLTTLSSNSYSWFICSKYGVLQV